MVQASYRRAPTGLHMVPWASCRMHSSPLQRLQMHSTLTHVLSMFQPQGSPSLCPEAGHCRPVPHLMAVWGLEADQAKTS